MALAIQLDLFKTQEQCEIEALHKMCEDTKRSGERVRKSLFARNNELQKQIMDLTQRLEIIERNLCKGK